MTGLRIGSLFSGAGQLDEGVRAVIGGTVAWHVEVDPAASRVLDYRYPDVPNLGDVTAVDWAAVEPVDVITGGSPCQDVSSAGRRAGMRAGTRSGLWASMVDAIDIQRPSLVVWENVRGALSAEADSALEPCPGCVGDGDDGAVLRALGRVLGDLADVGYDAGWYGLRAADVGAPHGRFRIFVVAYPGRQHGQRRSNEVAGSSRRTTTPNRSEQPASAVAVAEDFGHERRRPPRDRRPGPTDSRLRTAPDADNDAAGDGREPRHTAGGAGEPAQHRRGVATDTGRARLGQHAGAAPTEETRPQPGDQPASDRGPRAAVDWGPYEPAIRRWELTLGRVAPSPTETGAKGGQRLSPRFVEWMLGWPDGWVTDVPGISRNDALRICGNGVVPQQAAAAVARLPPHIGEAAA